MVKQELKDPWALDNLVPQAISEELLEELYTLILSCQWMKSNEKMPQDHVAQE